MAEFAKFMETISSEGIETKLNELSDVLNKVLQVITKALDDLTVKMVLLEEKVYSLDQRLNQLQINIQRKKEQLTYNQVSQAIVEKPAMETSMQNKTNKTMETKPSTTESKELTPMSARAAVSSELKELFKKLKK